MSPIPYQPSIWVVTPVFNAERVLAEYFAGIEQTDYPKEKLKIVMADGGSSDKTRAIAESHGAILLDNPLKTGEAGKAVSIRYIQEELKKNQAKPTESIICLLDSDNIITQADWFSRMVEPFNFDTEIIGAEPLSYLYRPTDHFVTRYAAMMGMSDPITLFLGNYDRLNTITGRWTNLPIQTIDRPNFFYWEVNPRVVPTIGANGTCFRASFFDGIDLGEYLFDIDVLYEYTQSHKTKFAKVKIGIVHLYCRSIADFVRKQSRRVKDFHYFHSQGLRKYPWSTVNRAGILAFILACVTILPLLWQVVRGLSKKPDPAWLFHPLACWLTLWVYGSNVILNKLRRPTLADRTNWRQG